MADKTITPNKIFSGTTLMQLIKSVEDESKVGFESEDTELKLSFFLLVRKAFDDAYDKIKDHLTQVGVGELGQQFSGITGNYIKGSYTERGGSKYELDPAIEETEVDPNLYEKVTTYKVKATEVDAYVKKNRELPPGIQLKRRNKSLAISPTKESKAAFEQLNDQGEDMFYDLAIPEIEEEV